MDHARTRPNARRIQQIVWSAVLGTLLVSGGVTLANIDFRSPRVSRDTLTIETVQRGTMEVKISANGRLLARHVEQIVAQVTGRVVRTHVRPGDLVTPGQVLVELSNPQLVASADEAHAAWEGAVAELRAAEAELRADVLDQEIVVTQAEFSLERARLQLEANTRLAAEQVISHLDLERSRLDVVQLAKTHAIERGRLQTMRDNVAVQLAVKNARVAQLARARDRARDQERNLRIVAGIDGIVQALDADVGEQLQPGSAIGRIAERDRLYAELEVAARDAAEVDRGHAAVIDTRSRTVHGVVARVAPAVTAGAVIVDVELQGPPPPGSRPHLPVEGVIYISRLPDALYVGKPSYVKRDAAVPVYRLDGAGRYATRVTIQVGKVSLDHLQVLKGLREGDRIITSDIGNWQDEDQILID